MRNAESILFSGQGFDVCWERLKKCVQESSDKFDVCHERTMVSGSGAHTSLVQGDPLLPNASLGCGLLQAKGTRGTSAGKAQK